MNDPNFFIQRFASSSDLDHQIPFAKSPIEIWMLSLKQMKSNLRILEKLLCAQETKRASRFHFAKDREEFIITRGTLYQFLAHYLKKEPEELSLEYNEYGKPSIENGREIFFNLSHSEDFALLAFSKIFQLGIDIEYIDPSVDVMEMAKHCLTGIEIQFLQENDKSTRKKIFFEYWTLKEALMKGVGSGFSIAPQTIEMAFETSRHNPKLTCNTNKELLSWNLWLLDEPAPYYAASIAILPSTNFYT